MNLEGKKISGSRNWAVWGFDFLSRYEPDTLRYYLTANMPESKDTDWDWQDFLNRNNNELVATWGNLVNRVLSFAYKHWDGQVPSPGELRPTDLEILSTVETGFQTIGDHINAVNLRAGLIEAMRLAAEVNKYLDQSAPWFEIKTDKAAAATTIFTAIKVIDSLKILLSPYLPFSSEQLHKFLGYDAPLFGEQFTETVTDNLGDHEILRYNPAAASGSWEPSQLSSRQELRNPRPLFRKLDDDIVASERSRLGQLDTSQD
jgi:methionyl-tRNA synthetase